MNQVIANNQTAKLGYADEVLKATALLYLSDALLKEEYETCGELVAIAKGFGADQTEISNVIAELSRGAKVAERSGANKKKKGRL